MVEADMKLAEQEKVLQEAGHTITTRREP